MARKESLRLVIAETKGREAAELLPLCDDSARPPGRWTARDNLAHLAAWRGYAASVLSAVRTGETVPAWLDDPDPQNFDAQNARIFEANMDISAAAVAAAVRDSWAALEAALEACSEEDLHRPRPGRPGHEAWDVVPGNAHAHLAEHLGYWHTEHGDAAAAEAAAVWAHDVDNRAFTDDKARATAAYNLACFYAREDRPRDALPHLERGLQMDPGVREWAEQDHDLDRVRNDPGIAALLEG